MKQREEEHIFGPMEGNMWDNLRVTGNSDFLQNYSRLNIFAVLNKCSNQFLNF
jgi:hypothetical protein